MCMFRMCKAIGTNSNLITHIRSGEKLYESSECGKNLVSIVIIISTNAFTLKKSHTNAHNVERNLISIVLLLGIDTFTYRKTIRMFRL